MKYYIQRNRDGLYLHKEPFLTNDAPRWTEDVTAARTYQSRQSAQYGLGSLLELRPRLRADVVSEASEDVPLVDPATLNAAELLAALTKIRASYTPGSTSHVQCGAVRWLIDYTLSEVVNARPPKDAVPDPNDDPFRGLR